MRNAINTIAIVDVIADCRGRAVVTGMDMARAHHLSGQRLYPAYPRLREIERLLSQPRLAQQPSATQATSTGGTPGLKRFVWLPGRSPSPSACAIG